jgi:hypothetical protein
LPESSSDTSFDSAGEANIVSFMVRLWKEESASEERQTIWRGHITFIPNGERHYFADINEITNLIRGLLKSHG